MVPLWLDIRRRMLMLVVDSLFGSIQYEIPHIEPTAPQTDVVS